MGSTGTRHRLRRREAPDAGRRTSQALILATDRDKPAVRVNTSWFAVNRTP